MANLRKHGLLCLLSCMLAAGCANAVLLEYSIDIPPDVPPEAKAQDKDCKVVTIQPRRLYARWHMEGWIVCLEGFIEEAIDLHDEKPLLPAVQSWGFATRGQEKGYHQCRVLLLEQVKLHGEKAVRSRAKSLLLKLRETCRDDDSPHWKQSF